MGYRTHLTELSPYEESKPHEGEASRGRSKRSSIQSLVRDWCDKSLLLPLYLANEVKFKPIDGQQNSISIKCLWLIDAFDEKL